MESGNANGTNGTASGGHLGYEEHSVWCEHTVIVLSVLMTLNMVALMLCYRMLMLGKIRKLLDRLVPPSDRQVMVTAPPKIPAKGSRSPRPSTDSFYPPTNLGPSTVVINNIGLFGAHMATTPITTAPARVGEKGVVMIQNPEFSIGESPLDSVGGDVVKREDRQRKISVFMDRPLPALPEQTEDKKKAGDGLEREEVRAERRVKKSSTGSAASSVQKEVSSSSSELNHPTTDPSETDSKSGLHIDIELFI